MPRPPVANPHVQVLRPSVFTQLAARFPHLPSPPIPLHLGDTYRQPHESALLHRAVDRLPANGYQYAHPNGYMPLRQALADRCGRDGLPGVTADDVVVTVGGTGAIAAIWHMWLQPGDEVLLLSPYWPLVRGIIESHGGVPVEVPFYDRLRQGETPAAILRPHLTDRTVALYVTSPNNPCGTVLTPEESADLAKFCVDSDLWVMADEAYYHYVYADAVHTWMATLPGMKERTASVFTASKSYALAGLRIGFVVGHGAWLETLRLSCTHHVYQVPLVGQLAVLGAIEGADPWVSETRELYQQAAATVASRLDAKFRPAQGGGYVFIDLTDDLQGQSAIDWLLELLEQGVCLSPGNVFGQDFSNWARVCYTAVPPEQLHLALDKLNGALARLRAR